jgi:hypothetical protein
VLIVNFIRVVRDVSQTKNAVITNNIGHGSLQNQENQLRHKNYCFNLVFTYCDGKVSLRNHVVGVKVGQLFSERHRKVLVGEVSGKLH